MAIMKGEHFKMGTKPLKYSPKNLINFWCVLDHGGEFLLQQFYLESFLDKKHLEILPSIVFLLKMKKDFHVEKQL